MADETSQSDFDDTPQGHYSRLKTELEAAQKAVKPYHEQVRKILDQYLDKGRGTQGQLGQTDTKLNFFWSDTCVKEAMLYGKVPKTDVSRTFGDARDQVGRIAGEIVERLLNQDVERTEDEFAFAFGCDVKDFLQIGLAVLKMRYEVEWETKPGKPALPGEADPETGEIKGDAPEVPDQEVKKSEDVPTDYVWYKDVLWSPCRTWPPRWIAFKSQMTRAQLIERFSDALGEMFAVDAGSEGDWDGEAESLKALGKSMAKRIPLNSKHAGVDTTGSDPVATNDPWGRAEVWEIWSAEDGHVTWMVEGMEHILDRQEDPLGIPGFYPCPRFLVDNWTTTEFMPRPSYVLTQDLLESINDVSTRLTHLQRQLKVKGIYDQSNEGLKRLVNEAADGEMIPVAKFENFREKGGLAGAFELFPLRDIAQTILDLRAVRTEDIDLYRQLTGMGDVLRGQTKDNGTPGEAQLEAKFGSVRMQSIQNELARFASDAMRIRAEIISRHFDPETIYKRSNAKFMFDGDQQGLVQQAIQLIKSGLSDYRITVKPESVALDDFSAAKGEAVELLESVGKFIQLAQPLVTAAPTTAPMVMELFQWAISRLKGGKEVEGVVTRMGQALAAPKPPQQGAPDPTAGKLRLLQAKAQIDAQHDQRELVAHRQDDASEAAQHNSEEEKAHQLAKDEAAFRARLDVEKARAIEAAKAPHLYPSRVPPMGRR